MRPAAGFVTFAVLVGALAPGVPALAQQVPAELYAAQQYRANPYVDPRMIEQAIRSQEQRIAEQERRLAEQERRLAEQGRMLDEQIRARDEMARYLAYQQQLVAWQYRQLEAMRARYWYGARPQPAPATAGAWGYAPGYAPQWQYAGAGPAPQPPLPVPPTREAAPGEGQGPSAAEGEPPAPRAPIPPETQPPVTGPAESGEPGEIEAERPKAEKPREELLLERGAILLPAGTLQIEPSVEYAHVSGDRVAISGFTIFEAIVIGTIRVDRIDRDIVTSTTTARLGVTDRIQLETRVPGVYRKDTEVLGIETTSPMERTIDNTALGDIELTGSWQAWIGGGAVPDVIVRLRSRLPTGKHPFEIETETIEEAPGERRLTEAPTGTGFYGVGPAVTLVWQSDPAVFFVGGGYLFNLKRDFGVDFGIVDPGDTLEFFAGFNVALSEIVAFNISFVDQVTGITEQNDIPRPGTSANDGRFVFGASIGLSPNMSLLVSGAAGMTEQSPDFVFSVSVPVTFDLI